MLKKFKQHLHQNFPFLEEGKLLIAVSGGIDSVVLAHLCSQLNLNFSLCHCNFNLRGQESNDDEVGRLDILILTDVPSEGGFLHIISIGWQVLEENTISGLCVQFLQYEFGDNSTNGI